ncbi:hypothetical protein [[Clostridium] fimetarium]|uniref:LPXTG-motif cell wall anchor domain-containing protein n=1 Tax=[Clostridium] fimetarium TaxID=99656 RepID=A0A1I0PIH4_9FIRM|nr:hypothetical protein [[Clostridium] fimetarium]SEW13565.1 hypothetical protein SAMN05421659_10576 [[Clostridium] fimetarium]
MKSIFKKVTAGIIALVLTLGTVAPAVLIYADTATPSANTNQYPWSEVVGGTTGDYIADSFKDIPSGHVFESVTQERLLDILSSTGNYYIVFGNPKLATTQAVLSTINTQAKADGITKIYYFDPFVDGYQIDITNSASVFKTSNGTSVNQLWTRITDLLPKGAPIENYKSSDTLLFVYNNNGSTAQITASYSLQDATGFNAITASSSIANVFKGGVNGGSVIQSSIRSDFAFFKRVYNSSATYFNANNGAGATLNKTGEASTELFTDADEAGFVFHQVNFVELLDLLNSPGDHIIFFGASWCHNTQAIIKDVASKAKQYGQKTVYVYDTTLGNQLTFGTGENINKVTASSSVFNSRNSVSTTTPGNGNISYVYGELVKYLDNYFTENNSKQNNSITYYPNGDLTGAITSKKPWETGTYKNAIRLQLPFLISYNKAAVNPVTKQWLHKNAANDGTYTEYMLDLAWVLKTPIALADTAGIDGLSKVNIASEAVKALDNVLKPDGYTANYPILSNFTTFTGAGNSSARIDADISDFVQLLYNGQVVDSQNYTLESGSTIITLKEAYLKTLGTGAFNFTAQFEDGTVALTLNLDKQSVGDEALISSPVEEGSLSATIAAAGALNSPATGDSTNYILWILAGAASIFTIGAFTFDVKRRKKIINNH